MIKYKYRGDSMNEPLAIKLRPTKTSEIIGQTHLVGENKIISNMVKNGKLFSMILYGKPGIGKTAIVEGLAYRIQKGMVPDALKNYSLIKINITCQE